MTGKMGRLSNRHAFMKCVEDVGARCDALQCSVAIGGQVLNCQIIFFFNPNETWGSGRARCH
jgi:hypothetical protein